jgi:hypothetical protein
MGVGYVALLKGTMSEAELHILKQRMWQGALNKARRGDLFGRVPIGYVRTAAGQTEMNPDEQVRGIVRLVFNLYDRLGTIHGVLRHLVRAGVQLPFRVHTGPDKGQVEWRRPNQSTLKNILSHPIYAGAYVYGRSCPNPQTRQRRRCPKLLPRDEWLVLLRDRLPAYITWQEYEANQERMRQNRSRRDSRGSVRRGRALVAGLVVCGRCGSRMSTQYCGPASQPRYFCTAKQTAYGEPRCQSLAARVLDDEVVRLTWDALSPAALEVSLRVAQDIQSQRAEAEGHWRKRLERAAYEAERAARQYRAVEPENRLVARTLEAAWEERLREHRDLQERYQRSQGEHPKVLSAAEREQIRWLAGDVPSLWHAPGTTDADRKEILREVIDRVVVNVEGESEWVEAKVYWAGGHQTYTRFRRPVARFDQLSSWSALRQRVSDWVNAGVGPDVIAERLNSEGYKTPNGKPFGEPSVQTLVLRCNMSASRRKPPPGEAGLRENEWFLPQLAAELGVGHQTVYGWVRKGRISARRLADGRWVVTADADKRRDLTAFQDHQRQRQNLHEAASQTAKL